MLNVSEGAACYWLGAHATTWKTAAMECDDMGGQLAILHTYEQYEDMLSHLYMPVDGSVGSYFTVVLCIQ